MTADRQGIVCDICKGEYNLVDDHDGSGEGPWTGYVPFAVACKVEKYRSLYWIVGGPSSMYSQFHFGAFVFLGDPPEEYKGKDVDVCDVCVRELISYGKIKHRDSLPNVVCRVCQVGYNRLGSGLSTEQGNDCAAHGFVSSGEVPCFGCAKLAVSPGDYLIKGCYGSTDFDCELYRFVGERLPPYDADLSPICDNCIHRLIDDGKLEHIPGHYP